MKTKPAYLVINTYNQTIARSTQRWPQLNPGEVVVRVSVEIPESLMPLIQIIVIEDVEAARIAVEPMPTET